MSKVNNKLLIICYSFPPHPGIGGRRWAKFSKIISLSGHDIFVINAKNISNSLSLWTKDVNVKELKIKSIHFQFQKILKNPKNIFNKILRKFLLFFIKKTKYNQHIITSLPNKKNWNFIKKTIIKNNIKTVIVSGDPYLFYYASLLKKEINFDLILDYRDLWNDHSFYEKKIDLSISQKQFFEFAENYAVNNCNKIIVVDEHLKNIISKRIKTNTIPTSVIHNGFDSSDLIVNPSSNVNPDKIEVFFAGSIASDLNDLVLEFALAFKQISENDSQTYNKFRIYISGEIDALLIFKIKQLNLANLTIENKIIDFEQYYRKLNKANVGLVILSDEYKNSFITKFTDYLLYDKFILSIGPNGAFAEYIEKNNIGLGFDPKDSANSFKKLLEKIKDYKILNEDEKRKFDLKFLTKKLITEVIEA